MLPSSNALPSTVPVFTLPLSHCVLGSLCLPLSYHLFSLLGMGSFYCLKGTLLTTHICPFIILRGLFYSCLSTVADVDQCFTVLNGIERVSVGHCMCRKVRETQASEFSNGKIWIGVREIYQNRTDGC